MKKSLKSTLISGVFLAGAAAMPAWADLEQGAAAPMFTAPASLNGKEFTYSLKEAVSKGPTVVYFYPSAYTQGCNIQAHTFAINMDKFKDVGASVVGVSFDSIERLNDFSADPEYCAGELPVVSDEDGSIATSFDIQAFEGRPGMKDTRGVEIDHSKFASRTTFILDSDGKVVTTIGGREVSPEDNVMQSLAQVQALAGR